MKKTNVYLIKKEDFENCLIKQEDKTIRVDTEFKDKLIKIHDYDRMPNCTMKLEEYGVYTIEVLSSEYINFGNYVYYVIFNNDDKWFLAKDETRKTNAKSPSDYNSTEFSYTFESVKGLYCMFNIKIDMEETEQLTKFERLSKGQQDETKALVSLYESLYYEPSTTLETKLMILGKVQKLIRI